MSAEGTVVDNTTSVIQEQVEKSVNTAASAAESPEESTPQEQDFRVFVGRLNTSTKKSEIRSLFETVGPVRKVTIPFRRVRRGTRLVPSGIAFVTFTNEEDVQKAIDTLNEKTLNEREIVVQRARPVQKQPKKSKKELREKTTANEENNETAPTAEDAEASSKEEGTENKENSETPSTEKKQSGKSRNAAGKKKAKPLPPNSIYVSGLSVTLTNEGLKEMFDAYNPIRARIAVRSLPPYIIRRIKLRGEQRRGRGFGFVSFNTPEEQTRAINEMNGKQVGDLTLVVKNAISREEKQKETEDKQDENEAASEKVGEKAETEEAAPATTEAPNANAEAESAAPASA
ncbi:single-stranded telomeric binding protein Tgc1 [Schizosaccharomyces cryophilus OY26]|uniref:Single-stranded telomeric binding protein Tgc1 n=1 Tax=Schizosaccharomyces cryophilus (strain OY26 / ATCC MYA-4695 / CBS 11777 / NBRC 106824 / NRRL Y48691) TaxID=653667 RepID=S9VNM2_SCHCR|nr:single-stranded telomeric binding protein Tgc1 [Schizosaccharomyces cryophilus OY26]EPY49568.1 single-stranded telomeric binding protein Tgc1 [Schizosaccharomyces cryophilus OY26]